MRDLFPASKDWDLAHPFLRPRWETLSQRLVMEWGVVLQITEIYRSNDRQGWLYGQGRTAVQLEAKGVNPDWARPGKVVTNAWNTKTSAHGYTLNGKPAACALDVVPIGEDAKPWTEDDDWDLFVKLTTDEGSLGWDCGLIHFHRPGVAVWDKPHLQMVEYSDVLHDLRFN